MTGAAMELLHRPAAQRTDNNNPAPRDDHASLEDFFSNLLVHRFRENGRERERCGPATVSAVHSFDA